MKKLFSKNQGRQILRFGLLLFLAIIFAKGLLIWLTPSKITLHAEYDCTSETTCRKSLDSDRLNNSIKVVDGRFSKMNSQLSFLFPEIVFNTSFTNHSFVEVKITDPEYYRADQSSMICEMGDGTETFEYGKGPSFLSGREDFDYWINRYLEIIKNRCHVPEEVNVGAIVNPNGKLTFGVAENWTIEFKPVTNVTTVFHLVLLASLMLSLLFPVLKPMARLLTLGWRKGIE